MMSNIINTKDKKSNQKKEESLFVVVEKKIIFKKIVINTVLFLVSITLLIFLVANQFYVLFTIPFILYSFFSLASLIKNFISYFFLVSAIKMLDPEDIDMNIFFKWHRLKNGNNIMFIFFTIFWTLYCIFVNIFLVISNNQINNEVVSLFFLFGLILFIVQFTLFLLYSKIYDINFDKVNELLPWSETLSMEIELVRKQATKDYVNITIIISSVILVIPAIAFFIIRVLNFRNLRKQNRT